MIKKRIVFPLFLALILGMSACSEDVSVGSSDSSGSGSSGTSSKSTSEQTDKLDKQTKLNFSNTSAQQTTVVDSAEIRNVADLNLVDNEFDEVKYALLIHMSVANEAKDTATTFPSQGHVVLDDGTQIEGLVGADVNIDDAFKDGDVASGAKVSGYVIFPLKEEQAKNFKKGEFKFDVLAGDDMLTQKNYSVPISFK